MRETPISKHTYETHFVISRNSRDVLQIAGKGVTLLTRSTRRKGLIQSPGWCHALQEISWGFFLCGALLATGTPLVRCSLRLLGCALSLAAPFLTVFCLALLHPTLGAASGDKIVAVLCLALLHFDLSAASAWSTAPGCSSSIPTALTAVRALLLGWLTVMSASA